MAGACCSFSKCWWHFCTNQEISCSAESCSVPGKPQKEQSLPLFGLGPPIPKASKFHFFQLFAFPIESPESSLLSRSPTNPSRLRKPHHRQLSCFFPQEHLHLDLGTAWGMTSFHPGDDFKLLSYRGSQWGCSCRQPDTPISRNP